MTVEHLKTYDPDNGGMRMTRFLQNWGAGLHRVGMWHRAYPHKKQMIMLYRETDLESKRGMAKELAGVKRYYSSIITN